MEENYALLKETLYHINKNEFKLFLNWESFYKDKHLVFKMNELCKRINNSSTAFFNKKEKLKEEITRMFE